MLPVLGRKVIEGEQGRAVLGQAGGGLVVLRAVLAREAVEGGLGSGAVLGLVDGVEVLLRLAWAGR